MKIDVIGCVSDSTVHVNDGPMAAPSWGLGETGQAWTQEGDQERG